VLIEIHFTHLIWSFANSAIDILLSYFWTNFRFYMLRLFVGRITCNTSSHRRL